MDSSELVTVSQAAEALSATSQTIRNWIREDRLRAVRIGNRFLIPRTEVQRLLGDATTGATRESNWEYDEAEALPLQRAAKLAAADADPADGLLGA